MSGRIRTWLRRGGVAAAVVGALPLVLPAAHAVHAAATTTMAFYSMDESPGATVLVDSSGNGINGTIGADVVTGVQVDGATANRFPLVPTAQPPTHPEHLDRVPDNSLLDPGTSDYAVTVRYRTGKSNRFGSECAPRRSLPHRAEGDAAQELLPEEDREHEDRNDEEWLPDVPMDKERTSQDGHGQEPRPAGRHGDRTREEGEER